jgi:hypothetical protein
MISPALNVPVFAAVSPLNRFGHTAIASLGLMPSLIPASGAMTCGVLPVTMSAGFASFASLQPPSAASSSSRCSLRDFFFSPHAITRARIATTPAVRFMRGY